jgi:hypothetical protein
MITWEITNLLRSLYKQGNLARLESLTLDPFNPWELLTIRMMEPTRTYRRGLLGPDSLYSQLPLGLGPQNIPVLSFYFI